MLLAQENGHSRTQGGSRFDRGSAGLGEDSLKTHVKVLHQATLSVPGQPAAQGADTPSTETPGVSLRAGERRWSRAVWSTQARTPLACWCLQTSALGHKPRGNRSLPGPLLQTHREPPPDPQRLAQNKTAGSCHCWAPALYAQDLIYPSQLCSWASVGQGHGEGGQESGISARSWV